MYGPLSYRLARVLTEERLKTAEALAAHRFSLPIVEEILPAWRASSQPAPKPTSERHASPQQALR